MQPNCKVEEREQTIFGQSFEQSNYSGEVCYFDQMSVETLRRLVEQKFVYSEAAYEDAPSISELLSFSSAVDCL